MYLHIAIVGGVNLYRFESASRHGDTRLCGSESDWMKAYASATEAKEQFEAALSSAQVAGWFPLRSKKTSVSDAQSVQK